MKLDVNGREAYAYTGGKPFDAALPCVVFIHGALNDHSVWTLLARWFAHHGYGVLAVDLPGHGRSAGPPLPSVEALADWVLALLDAAGVQQAALVGHSMGSLIALEAAARAPERVTRLVMLGTAYPMKVSDALLTHRARRAAARHRHGQRAVDQHAGQQAQLPRPGHVAARQQPRADAQPCRRWRRTLNLFEHDFRLCDAYSGGAAARPR